MKRHCSVVLGLCILHLTACGGHDSSSPTVTPNIQTEAFPIETAAQNFFSISQYYNLSGTTANGAIVTALLSFISSSSTNFNGKIAFPVTQNLILKSNGSTVAQGDETIMLQPGTGTILGETATNIYGVVTSGGTLPASAQVGQKGVFLNETLYTDSSKSSVYATGTGTWELDQSKDSSVHSALLCLNYTYSVAAFNKEACLTINTEGTFSSPMITLNYNGQMLTLQ